MEALGTRVDNLQWEVHRLNVENRKLRDQDPEAGERVDREAELERAKTDVAELKNRVQENEQRLDENAGALQDAERRAEDAEMRARDLEERINTQAEMHQQQLQDAVSEATRHNSMAERSELETTLQESEQNVAALREELSQVQHSVQELEHRGAAEREAMLRQSELDRYRAVEEERRKWEERESRWCAKITSAEEELRSTRPVDTTTAAQLAAVEAQLQLVTSQLEST